MIFNFLTHVGYGSWPPLPVRHDIVTLKRHDMEAFLVCLQRMLQRWWLRPLRCRRLAPYLCLCGVSRAQGERRLYHASRGPELRVPHVAAQVQTVAIVI